MARRLHRPLTVVALLLALFMAAMEFTVVSTAMPTVVADLGGIEHYAWVFASYTVAATVTVPLYGKLADLYGRKPILLFGLLLFLLGSAASGEASSMTQLIAWRAVQGLGAGAMQPVTITVVGDLFDLDERTRWQAVFGAVWAIAGVVGPLLGGFLVETLSWRWVFFINLPFGVVAAALLGFALHEEVERRPRRLDVAGAGLLAGLVVTLLVGAQRSDSIALGAVAAVPLAAALVWVERRAAEPILPPELFRHRLMWVSSAAGATSGAAMFSVVTFVPLYVQGVLGGTPTEAGGAVAPMVIGWPVASAVAGRLIPRAGFRPLIVLGFAVTALASFLLARVTGPEASLPALQLATFTYGVGMGFANTSLLIAVQTSVAWRQRGVATASTLFFRTMGGAVAVGLFGALLTARLARAGDVPPDTVARLLGPERSELFASGASTLFLAALGEGLRLVFRAVAALGAAALALSALFPRPDAVRVAP